MSKQAKKETAGADVLKPQSHFRTTLKRMSYSKTNIVCACIVLLYIIVALLAPVICKYGYREIAGRALLAPCREHLFGTDTSIRRSSSACLKCGMLSRFNFSSSIQSPPFPQKIGRTGRRCLALHWP